MWQSSTFKFDKCKIIFRSGTKSLLNVTSLCPSIPSTPHVRNFRITEIWKVQNNFQKGHKTEIHNVMAPLLMWKTSELLKFYNWKSFSEGAQTEVQNVMQLPRLHHACGKGQSFKFLTYAKSLLEGVKNPTFESCSIPHSSVSPLWHRSEFFTIWEVQHHFQKVYKI